MGSRKIPTQKVANTLRETFENCDLVINQIGTTYIADHVSVNNTIAESLFDQVYCSKQTKSAITITLMLFHLSYILLLLL